MPNEPEWKEIDPVKLNDLGYESERWPFPCKVGVELKLQDGQQWLIGTIPHHAVNADEGCGCCSGGRWEVVVAWRDWEIYPDV